MIRFFALIAVMVFAAATAFPQARTAERLQQSTFSALDNGSPPLGSVRYCIDCLRANGPCGMAGVGVTPIGADAMKTNDGWMCLSRASGGSGTVTSVSVTPANGISGTVTDPTSTPAITLDIAALNATKIADGSVTNAEFQFIGTLSSNAQTQLNAKQPLDADLTDIAGLAPSNDDVLQRKAGAWANRTIVQVKTDLALTKSDVGLGNVDNTSDANKPVSTAQQTALDLKANIASPTFTGTPAAPTAAADTNTTQLATTAHVFAERSNSATLTNKTLTTPTIGSFTNATHSHTNAAGGGQLTDAALSAVIGLAKGGTGVALADPGADRLLFWDDSAGVMEWLTLGTNLSITGTTINAAGSSIAPLVVEDANTVAQRNGTTAQTFYLYNTFTNASNYERLAIWWQGSEAYIQTQGLGTGAQRRLNLDAADQLNLQIGGTTQWRVDASGDLLPLGDNADDIGLAASRPRTIRAGTSMVTPLTDFPEAAAPATPAASTVRLYAKTDGLLYSKDDAGVETVVSGGGGGTTINATDGVIPYRFNSTTFADSPLTRVDANTLEQRNTTNAQTFRLYETTDAGTTNYSRLTFRSDSGYKRIEDQIAGTGASSGLVIVTPGLLALQGASHYLQDASGATTYWRTSSGHLITPTDNTYNIGASGATRPHSIFAGTLVAADYARIGDGAADTYATFWNSNVDPTNAFALAQGTDANTVLNGAATIDFRIGNNFSPNAGRLTATTFTLGVDLLFTGDNARAIGAPGATRPSSLYLGTGLAIEATITAGGTTGAQTIDKTAGSVNFAAAGASLVVTNNKVTATSIVMCTVATNDATMKSVQCVPAAGSFTIFGNAAATAETRVNFWVLTPD